MSDLQQKPHYCIIPVFCTIEENEKWKSFARMVELPVNEWLHNLANQTIEDFEDEVEKEHKDNAEPWYPREK